MACPCIGANKVAARKAKKPQHRIKDLADNGERTTCMDLFRLRTMALHSGPLTNQLHMSVVAAPRSVTRMVQAGLFPLLPEVRDNATTMDAHGVRYYGKGGDAEVDSLTKNKYARVKWESDP
ncbi:unnamed protein product [Cercospora beticola]|nr:unnamed protein product [Cercospora beticola]